MSYLQKICIPKEPKDINVKAFNMITDKNEAKTMKNQISCDCKCKFNSTTCNSNQKTNNKTCKCECKGYNKCEKDFNWNSNTCICENSKFLKSIAFILFKKFLNCHSKKVRILLYFSHSFISNHILLIINIICYNYVKQKSTDALTI